jgi:hypothetical protein
MHLTEIYVGFAVGFIVDRMAMEQVFSLTFSFPCQYIPAILRNHIRLHLLSTTDIL